MSNRTKLIPVTCWPSTDRAEWQRALRDDDLFGPASIAFTWRPATVSWVADGYGRALFWLARNGFLDPERPAAERWTIHRLHSYLAEMRLQSLGTSTIRNRLTALERALAVIAPSADRSLLQSAVKQLTARTNQNSKRERLQDPRRLVDLGCQLMARAEVDAYPQPRKNAALFRDGLQIALLALRPLRRKNFSDLRIGSNVVRKDGMWWIDIRRSETKTRQPIEMPFPECLVPALEEYLERYRPLLSGDVYFGDALWVSYRFAAQAPHSIQLNIVKRTERAFGKSVNPHLFRDCLATTIAINDPDNIRMAATILGHRTFSTTEKHYNLARTLQAGDAFQGFLKKRRRNIKRQRTGSVCDEP